MHIWGETLTVGASLLLILAVALALTFEMVNGFHDTANAVATVIYTHTLRPWIAVIWSGICNLCGVLHSTGAVAFGIVALLPTDLVVNISSGPGFAMIFSLLISAIIWNLGTWYLGLPASSSHSLIGSIMGVALANSAFTRGFAFGDGVNWKQAKDVALSLLVSPAVGFVGAAVLLLLLKVLVRQPQFFAPADAREKPPLWVRGILILTCTGVSFAHGSNDGQKGMGLLMLILVGVVPGAYALNLHVHRNELVQLIPKTEQVSSELKSLPSEFHGDLTAAYEDIGAFLKTEHAETKRIYGSLLVVNDAVNVRLHGLDSLQSLSTDERKEFRKQLYLLDSGLEKLTTTDPRFGAKTAVSIAEYRKQLDHLTKYIADWVKIAVALALGLGTMVGWRRIVVTVGEKIGKSHLSYAQGASAELVAMATISLADHYGLPVSTTHVLSSGVAGAMTASHSGLQTQTLRNLVLAWVLTLPVCMLLGAGFFSAALYFVFHTVGRH